VNTKRILVVEDDSAIRQGIVDALRFAGYDALPCGTGHEGMREALRATVDLVMLDLILPGPGGFEILKAARAARPTLPVIILTARGEEADRVKGLRLGADDYLSKPFSAEELVLRVQAVLRRVNQHPPARPGGLLLRAGPVSIDTGAAQVDVSGKLLVLTPTEYRLLFVLMERRGRVQTRRQLLEAVWETTAHITTRTVDMHIQRLRTKLGEASDWLETVRGFGYRFRSE
jgi:two-component system phosphate regulon response regulator PhoB